MPQTAADWSLEEPDARRIDQLLLTFLTDTHARYALLVDRAGQLVTLSGESPAFDPTAFASLAAADFAANDRLAAMIGEREFADLAHQGQNASMYLADVGRRVILVVLFDGRATLGMIRIKARPLVAALEGILAPIWQRAAGPDRRRLEHGWAEEAGVEIERLFGSR